MKCEKRLCNCNITYDKANSTIQVDAKHVTDNRHFRKKKKLSYAEVLRKGKDISSPKIDSTTTESPKITQNKGVIDLVAIRSALLKEENCSSAEFDTFPPVRDSDSSVVSNSLNSSIYQEKYFDAQDEEMLKVLEELHSSNRETSVVDISSIMADENSLTGYFYSDTIFNLSNRVLSDNEIKVLEKGLNFAPIQRKINEPELRSDFGKFCRRMRIMWHFRNEPTLDFSEKSAFHTKSS